MYVSASSSQPPQTCYSRMFPKMATSTLFAKLARTHPSTQFGGLDHRSIQIFPEFTTPSSVVFSQTQKEIIFQEYIADKSPYRDHPALVAEVLSATGIENCFLASPALSAIKFSKLLILTTYLNEFDNDTLFDTLRAESKLHMPLHSPMLFNAILNSTAPIENSFQVFKAIGGLEDFLGQSIMCNKIRNNTYKDFPNIRKDLRDTLPEDLFRQALLG